MFKEFSTNRIKSDFNRDIRSESRVLFISKCNYILDLMLLRLIIMSYSTFFVQPVWPVQI